LKKKQEKRKKWIAKQKKNNPVLKRYLNLSKNKVKGKDGKWKDKMSFGLLYNKIQKNRRNPDSLLNKIFGTKSEKDSKNTDLQEKIEELEDRNEELEDKMKEYEKVFSGITINILNYVSNVHNNIQEVSDDYKGFINFDDDTLLNKIKEKQDIINEHHEESDQDKIKRHK
jgi:gas vesicle protein